MAIVKKYSDYVRYPIQMEREKSRQKPEPDRSLAKPEWETPSWKLEFKKQKSEVTDEQTSTRISSATGPASS